MTSKRELRALNGEVEGRRWERHSIKSEKCHWRAETGDVLVSHQTPKGAIVGSMSQGKREASVAKLLNTARGPRREGTGSLAGAETDEEETESYGHDKRKWRRWRRWRLGTAWEGKKAICYESETNLKRSHIAFTNEQRGKNPPSASNHSTWRGRLGGEIHRRETTRDVGNREGRSYGYTSSAILLFSVGGVSRPLLPFGIEKERRVS